MGYYKISIYMKSGKTHSGVRSSNKQFPFQWQEEFETKAFAAFGKDKVREVYIQPIPDDHPDVLLYLRKKKLIGYKTGRTLPFYFVLLNLVYNNRHHFPHIYFKQDSNEDQVDKAPKDRVPAYGFCTLLAISDPMGQVFTRDDLKKVIQVFDTAEFIEFGGRFVPVIDLFHKRYR